MKRSTAALLYAVLIVSCSTITEPDGTAWDQQTPPARKRNYGRQRGGVQITEIAYDQKSNRAIFNLTKEEEWIVLESDGCVNTQGWWLDGGYQDRQHFDIPDSIDGKLYIFTGEGNVPTTLIGSAAAMALGRHPPAWIWNDGDGGQEHDTARIYKADSTLVDILSY